MAFMGIPVVVGSPASIAEQIMLLRDESGIEGMLFSWPDFVSGVRRFGEEVMPLID